MTLSDLPKNNYKSPFSEMNGYHHDEPVATYTIYSDTAAIDDGSTCSQLFVGTKSLVSDVYGMKTNRNFVNNLEDNTHDRGAMSNLIFDCAQSEVINCAQSIIWELFIDDLEKRTTLSAPYLF